jgi:hypothetical protein
MADAVLQVEATCEVRDTRRRESFEQGPAVPLSQAMPVETKNGTATFSLMFSLMFQED